MLTGSLPLGALVATCVVERWELISEESGAILRDVNPREYLFGDYTAGRFAWYLTDLHPLPKPIPFTGSQGLFDVPDGLLGIEPSQGVLLDSSEPE